MAIAKNITERTMNNKNNGKLLEAKIVDVMTWKTLFEVMKDILGDIVIEFKQDTESMNRKEEKKEEKIEEPVIKVKKMKQKKKPVVEVESDDDEVEKSINNEQNDEEDLMDKIQNLKMINDDESQEKKSEGKNGDLGKEEQKKDSSGGMKIVAINFTKTLLILVKLDAKEFATFHVAKPVYDVGVNLAHLHKLIKSLDKDDILTVSVDEEDTQMLVLDVENETQNSRTRNRLKMLDINKTSYKIPATKFDVTVTMDAVNFHKICKEMSAIAEYVEIICKENSITFTCKGDCSEKSTTLETTDTNGIKIKFANPKKKTIIQGIFELKHFVMFTKCSSLCPNIQIYMKNNYPIFTRYTVAKLGHVLLGLIPITDPGINNNNFSDDEEDYSDNEKQQKL